MLKSVLKFANEPIILVQYMNPFKPDIDINAAQDEIANILKSNSGTFYRIDDLSDAPMDWDTFRIGIFVATRDVPGSMTDPRIKGLLVGKNELVQLASDRMKYEPYGGTNTPFFTEFWQALRYVREQINQHVNTTIRLM